MTEIDPKQIEAAIQGRYEILSQIGEGGMGTVFLARHRELNSRVAIKIPAQNLVGSANRLARFRREAAVSAQMSHPHIVSAFEFGVESNIAYLVMPYIEGIPLDDHLKQHGSLGVEEVRKLIEDIGGALAFAHNRGVVHRDVKPANILFETATGRWLLTDFGIAHILTDEPALTQSGASIGTPSYMAPEQLGGAADVDGRADLFALATVAYEALTTELPESMAAVDEIGSELRRARPDLTPRFTRQLVSPLALSRSERPKTVADWITDIKSASGTNLKKLTVGATAVVALTVMLTLFLAKPGAPTLDDGPVVVAVLPFAVSQSPNTVGLDSMLLEAFTWQLQTLPDLRVLPTSTVRTRIFRRFGLGPFTRDTLFAMAGVVRADQVLLGDVSASGDSLEITVQVYDTNLGRLVAGADAAGPLDSIHTLVSRLVVSAFAERLARERSGAPTPSLPSGLPAISAYFSGDRAFRRGAYPEALEHFERVIELDSTYAPAHLKRMLATALFVQPTKSGPIIQSALQAAVRYRDQLDPMSELLLRGYEILLTNGDVLAAEDTFRQAVNTHPDAVDAWFMLGLLRFRFGALLGTEGTLASAKTAFLQVVSRDPAYAAAIGMLAQVTILDGNSDATRSYMRRYLALDSVSVWAELVGLADSLLHFQEHAARLLGTFGSRPSRVLENVAIAAGELRQPGGTRPFAAAALDVLYSRAATPEGLTIAFRMRMAMYVAAGQIGRATAFVADAARRGVPQPEIDRWRLLTAATGLARLAAPNELAAAAQRLRQANDDPFISAWLGARWARLAGQNPAPFDSRMQELTSASLTRTPLHESLFSDIAALDTLARGDSAAALETWAGATRNYVIDDVIFGLVNSLWPLRLDRVRVASRLGDTESALRAAETFNRMGGFVDQAAWIPVLLAKAEMALASGDTASAIGSYRQARNVLIMAGSEQQELSDSLESAIADWAR